MESTDIAGQETPVLESHGARIPALGFGTWELQGETAERMTAEALEVGYRHIDTAQAYGNEDRVGRAIESSDVSRDNIFLTTKIWPDSYTDFQQAVDERLELLRTDRVDLLLLHWPRFDGTTLTRTIDALNRARREGKTRHIGVSNFNTDLLARAWAASEAPLVTNQVEYHPFLDQAPVLDAVREREMCLTAYSPLAHGEVPGDPTLEEIGRDHGASAAAVAIRWLIQQDGVVAIPRTSDPEHCRDNFSALELELDGEEMDRIAELARPDGRVIDPAGLAPEWD